MPRARRVHFNTVGHVLTEMGRKYDAANQGTMEWADAGQAVRILREIRQALEGGELERRLLALETALGEHKGKLKPNGSAGREARP